MFAIITNPNSNKSNLSSNDVEFNYFPVFLQDDNGIQYPLSILKKYTPEKIFNLFEIYTLENVNNYNENLFDGELESIVVENISVVDHKIIRTYGVVSKPQNIINDVNERRSFENSIDYRRLRREAYIRDISPEQDIITTIGDVLDALYNAVYHNDSAKLNELAIKIETIKASIPKPS